MRIAITNDKYHGQFNYELSKTVDRTTIGSLKTWQQPIYIYISKSNIPITDHIKFSFVSEKSFYISN